MNIMLSDCDTCLLEHVFAPDAVFVTGFAYANPTPTLLSVGTRAQVKTTLCGKKVLSIK